MGRRFWTVWVSSSASYLAEGLLFGSLPVLAASLTRDARLIAVTDALHHAGGTAITVWLARRDPKPVPVEGRAAPLKLLAEGLHYLARHRVLRSLAAAVAIVNLVTSGAIAVAVLYVLQELHLPQSTYGLVMASFITMPLGALLAGLGTHAIGLPWTYILGGFLLFVTAAVAVRPLQEMPNRP